MIQNLPAPTKYACLTIILISLFLTDGVLSDAKNYEVKTFIDATYKGDLTARANAIYTTNLGPTFEYKK